MRLVDGLETNILRVSPVNKFVIQMRFEVPSLYLILTKLGDIIDRLTRNLSEKFKAYPIIRHYVTAVSRG